MRRLAAGMIVRRHWGWGPDNPNQMGKRDNIFLKMDQSDRSMRIAGMRYTDLHKGDEYDSGEYVLTLHEGTWIHGAAPYREWVEKNRKRIVPISKHAREMFGYRFIWMFTGYPKDPDNIVWKYDDFPALADEMVEHGLYDLLP